MIAFEERFALRGTERKAPFALGKRFEKCASAFADAHQMLAQGRGFDFQDAQHRFGVAHQLVELVTGNTAAEIVARDVFDFVGFVKHHRGIFRQDGAEIVLTNRQVCEK